MGGYKLSNLLDFLDFSTFLSGEGLKLSILLNFFDFSTSRPGGGRVQMVEFIDLFDFRLFKYKRI